MDLGRHRAKDTNLRMMCPRVNGGGPDGFLGGIWLLQPVNDSSRSRLEVTRFSTVSGFFFFFFFASSGCISNGIMHHC